MADVTYYLDPELLTGNNDGTTEANAWQSWAACFTALNTNHADMITDTESVDVIIKSSETLASPVTLSVICNETYPLRFVVDPALANPGVWNLGNPYLGLNSTDSGDRGIIFDGGTNSWVEFVSLQFYWELVYTGTGYQNFFDTIITNKANTSRCIFDGCYVKPDGPHANTGTYTFWVESSAYKAEFPNTIIEGFTNSSTGNIYALRSTRGNDNAHHLFTNTTFIDVDQIESVATAAKVRMVGSLLINSAVGDTAWYVSPSGKNVSTAASGLPGSDNTYNFDDTGLFVSSTDRHITSSIGGGAGPSDGTYGSYVPTLDIDGDTRSGTTTDAGADLYVAAGVTEQVPSGAISLTQGTPKKVMRLVEKVPAHGT